MFDKMKQLMEMKKQADRLKKELDAVVIEVADVRGIKITVTGAQEFRGLEIDESFLNAGNKKRLEADLLKSLNSAVKKVQQAAAQKMMASGGIPGL